MNPKAGGWNKKLRWLGCALGIALSGSGCMKAYLQSVGADTDRVETRVYRTDFNTAWQSVLEALKSYRLDVSNREGGYLQTRWTENTAERNFFDSYGGTPNYQKAQFRYRVSVIKGMVGGQSSVKVQVQRDQLVQRDVLEGWRPLETDGIEEKTFLYRVGQVVKIRTRLAELEKVNEATEANASSKQ